MADLHTRIREILLRQWDPIGVANVPQAQDEYDPYVGEIAGAVRMGQPAAAITDVLVGIETRSMRLPADRDRALRVANSLVELLRG